MSHHPAYTMSGVCVAGGVAGYVRKKSVPSLLAGLGAAAAYAYAGYKIQNIDGDFDGHVLAAAAGVSLASFMGYRFLKTKKVMPTGVLCLLSSASAAFHSFKASQVRDLQ